MTKNGKNGVVGINATQVQQSPLFRKLIFVVVVLSPKIFNGVGLIPTTFVEVGNSPNQNQVV